MNIEEKVVQLLYNKNYTISCAESCTGGMLVSRIINVPNASKILNCSFVTYSNESKIKILGVDKNYIKKYGVVNEEIALQMACGVAETAKSNIGIGISGIAGPSGGTKNKPVGMVCFGFLVNNEKYTETKYFINQSRFDVRFSSTEFALNKLYELLLNE